MDDRAVRIDIERGISFSLGFNREKEVGLHNKLYFIGRDFGRCVSDAKSLIFSGQEVIDSNLSGFVGSLEKLESLRDKYANSLPCRSLEAVDEEIEYLEGIYRSEGIHERLK